MYARLARRLFAVAGAVLPRRFRQRHGEELKATFEDRLSEVLDRGPVARLRFLVRETAGVLWTALIARREGRVSAGVGMRRAGVLRRTFAHLVQDIRWALRGLARSPAFTIAAVLVLALGIGGAVAIFSAVDAVLLRAVPLKDADRLVALWESNRERGWERGQAAPANYIDWRERLTGFEGIAAYDDFLFGNELTGVGEPRRVLSNDVTGNFFDVLGVEPVLGRTFTETETWSTTEPVAILSWELWRSAFGGDPAVVGRTVRLNRRDVRIVGVMPAGLRFPREQTELWEPMRWSPDAPSQDWFRQAHVIRVVGRLQPGVPIERANAQLAELGRVLQREHPELNRGMEHGLSPLRGERTAEARTPLLALLGAVILLLLTAGANVGGLVLVRGLAREREIAVRAALGATRARVAGQLVVESAVLASLGGVAGLALGAWGIRLISVHAPAGLEMWQPMALDGRVLLFALAATASSALLFGLIPALRAGRLSLTRSLRGSSRTSAGSTRLHAGQALVVTELAFAVVLVLAAGLLTRSMFRLASVDSGVDTRNVLTLEINLPSASYDTGNRVRGFWLDLVDRTSSLPGVESAAATTRLPLTTTNWTSDFTAEGWPPDRYGTEVHHREVTAGYFETMRVPLLRGRLFDETDTRDHPARAVLINRTLSQRYFGDADPIGRRVTFERVASGESDWRTIVGVVGDERQLGLASEPIPEIYSPIPVEPYRRSVLAVRTSGDPLSLLPAVRSVVADMDPALPIYDVRTMDQVRAESVAGQRFVMALFGLFAGIALTLAIVGIYGVAMQAAKARTREVGIRMALGAEVGDVQRLMLRRGAVLVGAGLGIGVLVMLAAGQLLSSLLFRVEPTDPLTFATVTILLGATTAIANWLPARAASHTDPARVLRAE